MSFLGVGYQEILVVFVLMLVVVGPERMPKIAYQIGRAVRTMQGYARVIRDEFQGEMDYFKEEADMIKGELDGARATLEETQDALRTEQESLSADLDDAAKAVDKDFNDAAKAPSSNGTGTLSSEPPKLKVEKESTPDSVSEEPESDAKKPLLF